MSLIPFIYVACSESSQEVYACKAQRGEAMPLFPIPPPADRISNYDDIVKKSLISLDRSQSRNNAISGSRLEHQYILQLDTITDDSLVQDYRKIYAFASGEIIFHNTQKLTEAKWDIPTIFQNGKTPEAIELRPLAMNWQNYYPGYLPLDITLFYFNFSTADADKAFNLKGLINCHVEEEQKKKLLGDPLPSDWLEQYYREFLNQNPNASIPVNAGEVIGLADYHTDNSDAKKFRLSMHYLDAVTLADYSANLEVFIKYRGRIPTIHRNDKTGLGSIAGHPIVHLYTNTTVTTSRVDFVDQSIFKSKETASIALDVDKHPVALAYRRVPSPGQQSVLLSMGITQPEFEENKFTLYNPDHALLDIAVENTDVPSNDVQVDPAYIDGLTTQQDVKVVIPPTVSTASIQIYDHVAHTQPIQSIDLTFFDCVIIPVKFWKVRYTENSVEKKIADDVNLNEVLLSANRILGNQTNVYFKAIDSNSPLQVLDIITLSNAEAGQLRRFGTYLFDRNEEYHHREIQTQLQEKAAPEINVIWTWDIWDIRLAANKAGNTSTQIYDFPYPYIFIEVVQFIEEVEFIEGVESKKIVPVTDEDRGRILAHEFGHWLCQRNLNATTPEEQMNAEEQKHFDHDPNVPGGDDEFMYNLMQADHSKERESITTSQAQIYNQYSRKVINADPPL